MKNKNPIIFHHCKECVVGEHVARAWRFSPAEFEDCDEQSYGYTLHDRLTYEMVKDGKTLHRTANKAIAAARLAESGLVKESRQ